ncbi:MAG: hypothetical protein HY710_12040 [Candidatus Latescibacteria bacterium]|nr:hypothetical protein [Candidatus Latescibacterota bacterium]
MDRIGSNSRIERLAEEIQGTIIQMSMGYWPQQVAHELKRVLGYEHKLIRMEQSQIGAYLRAELRKVPLEELIGLENEEERA